MLEIAFAFLLSKTVVKLNLKINLIFLHISPAGKIWNLGLFVEWIPCPTSRTKGFGASFSKLTYPVFGSSFGNFLLCNTGNFLIKKIFITFEGPAKNILIENKMKIFDNIFL
jgi:hypothetical protein